MRLRGPLRLLLLRTRQATLQRPQFVLEQSPSVRQLLLAAGSFRGGHVTLLLGLCEGRGEGVQLALESGRLVAEGGGLGGKQLVPAVGLGCEGVVTAVSGDLRVAGKGETQRTRDES